MEQGDTNAPGTFARLISTILSHLIGASVYTYFDDVFIHTKVSLENQVRDVTAVLEVLEHEFLYCSTDKQGSFPTEVEFSGSIVNIPSHNIPAHPEKIPKITSWPTPDNFKNLSCFLGTAYYIYTYQPEFASAAAPLSDILEKDTWLWTDLYQTAFDLVKCFINGRISLHTLGYSKLESNSDLNAEPDKLLLDCDASLFGTDVWLG